MDRSDIRDNVRLITLVESAHVTDTQINDIINQGLHEISVAADWPFLYTSGSLSLTASTRTVATPSDFLRAVTLIDADNNEPLLYVSPNEFFSELGNDDDSESTTPLAWTLYGATPDIYLHPIPSTTDASRLTLYYYKEITTLSADSSVPEFHAAYHWALVEYAKWKLYEREEYYEEAERSMQLYLKYVEDMVAFYSRRVDISPGVFGIGRRIRRGDPNLPWWNRF